MSHSQRNRIALEDGRVLQHTAFEAQQYVLRIAAPRCAARATAGSFVHLSCDDDIPMRRPLSLMRVDATAGWIEVLYKIVGPGLAALARRRVGDTLSVLGPIGQGFLVNSSRRRPLLIGGGVGIPPLVFLAETLRRASGVAWLPLAMLGSEIPFPFRSRPSTILVPGMPAGVIASMPLLDEWGIPCRLATRAGFPGCFDGNVTRLADLWLGALDPPTRGEVEIFACGPTPMLAATAELAHKYQLPAQVSLEEFMACAVGGCAGCAVAVQTADGPAMKRVCVDGPVFAAAAVFPNVWLSRS